MNCEREHNIPADTPSNRCTPPKVYALGADQRIARTLITGVFRHLLIGGSERMLTIEELVDGVQDLVPLPKAYIRIQELGKDPD